MRTPNRWAMLSLGMAAQGAGCVFMYGLPYLLPTFQHGLGLSLAQAGVLVGAPSAGMLCTLIAWGWLADRRGERLVMTCGLVLATGFLVLAACTTRPVLLALALALAGAGGASANAASGRVVLGWFGREQRGLAMGLRQTAQPLGVAVAALLIPHLHGLRPALLAMAGICGVVAVAVGLLVVDPPRTGGRTAHRQGNPYATAALWRVHGASMALVVPQFTTSAFALTYLVSVRHWSGAEAGQVTALAQFLGAGGRLLCGRWSDLVASRVRPMRQLALVNAAVMALLAAAAATGGPAAPALLVVALVVSMSGNGLAFTAVSELAGTAWSGRALGIQNTGQNVVSAGTPASVGALVTASSYPVAFGLAGALALVAAVLTPPRDSEHEAAPADPAGADAPTRPVPFGR